MNIFLRDPRLCPVCGYPLQRPASDCDICPSCGTQFGYSDSGRTHEQLRNIWMQEGMNWHSQVHQVPRGWNPELQMIEAGFKVDRPYSLYLQTNGSITAVTESNEPTFTTEQELQERYALSV
jgi:hypothetical protein